MADNKRYAGRPDQSFVGPGERPGVGIFVLNERVQDFQVYGQGWIDYRLMIA